MSNPVALAALLLAFGGCSVLLYSGDAPVSRLADASMLDAPDLDAALPDAAWRDAEVTDTDVPESIAPRLVVSTPQSLIGSEVVFDATGSRLTPEGTLSYAWDFGDGTLAEGAVVRHTFFSAGTFEVQLEARSKTTVATATTSVRAVAAHLTLGARHACATWDGQVACWGANDAGQLGQPTVENATAPVVLPIVDAIGVEAGEIHTLAWDDAGLAFTWGNNEFGQLGTGDLESRPSIGQALGLGETGSSEGATGSRHSCVLGSNQAVRCWGANDHGQLGYGASPRILAPPLQVVMTNVKEISLGGAHSCLLSVDHRLHCFGANESAQLGYPDEVDRSRPDNSPVDLPHSPVQVSAGSFHTCTVLSNGDAYCWGRNEDGQLGYGDLWSGQAAVPRNRLPGPIVLGMKAAAISAGTRHTCALLEDGRVKCWGANDHGQLGYGDLEPRSEPEVHPIRFPGGRKAAAVVAGDSTTCAVLQDATFLCWGSDQHGLLGRGEIAGDLPAPLTPIAFP